MYVNVNIASFCLVNTLKYLILVKIRSALRNIFNTYTLKMFHDIMPKNQITWKTQMIIPADNTVNK